MPLVIEPAGPEELDVVMEIVDQAAVWLKSRGIRQWESPAPPEYCDLVRREIGQGRVYLVRFEEDAEAFATLRFEWESRSAWPEEKSAGYLYTLALRPRYMGLRLGEAILEWAKEHIRRQGRRWMRLDCIACNQRLRRYYEDLGFRDCGQSVIGSYTLALYELDLG